MTRLEQFKNIVSAFAEGEAVDIYADHLCEFFDNLAPERISEEVVSAIKNEDYATAIHLCAEHFRHKAPCGVSGLMGTGKYSVTDADKTVSGYAREVNIDWNFPNGEVDFLFNPTIATPPVNHEWLWQYNRHGAWCNLARTYMGTGDEKYAATYRKQILKWISQTYVPEKWNAPGSAWRTIECGIRLMGSWQSAFDGCRHSYTLEDAVILLIIASMHRQTVHLVKHPTGKNWLMMEATGTYTFAALFPEMSDAENNRTVATNHLLREMEDQILPDGMHNELSPDYQSVVLGCAYNFYKLAKQLGLAGEIPEKFVKLMKSTVDAAIALSTPGFTQPRTNDCYTMHTHLYAGKALEVICDAPEYRFVTSKRAEGEPPKGETASKFLPYAGFAVMRSDWSADATYMCFDVGPLGMGHWHQDKLNINIYKGNEELIFDDGGGQYEISDARNYALSGYGHNTALVDGLAQQRGEPKVVTEPIDAGWITNAEFDYAFGIYDDTFGSAQVKPATHKREVRFCKPDFFCVTDTLTSADGNTHDYELLFRMDTTEIDTVPEYKNAVISKFGKKYEMVMIPLDCECAETEISSVSAGTDPYQGWYNGRNESNLHPAITVSRKVSGRKNYKFTTLFFPVEKTDALPKIEKTANGQVTVTFKGKEHTFNLNTLNK